MTSFDEQMLRLKQVLGLTADQDIAALLRLTKSALSVRKRRDAFPIEAVERLAQTRPELRIDLRYIVTGESTQFLASLGMLREASKIHSDVAKRDALAGEMLALQPSSREAALLADFRHCSSSDQDVLTRIAATMARSNQPTPG